MVREIKYCKKCGSVKGRKSECSNCRDIELIKQGKGRFKEHNNSNNNKNKKTRKKTIKQKQKRFCFRKRKSGESLSNYYNEYIKSIEWKRKRNHIYKKYKNKCEICGHYADNIHHWYYNKTLGTEEARAFSPLCKKCHDILHEKFQDYLEEIRISSRKQFKKNREKIIREISENIDVDFKSSKLDEEYFNIIKNNNF